MAGAAGYARIGRFAEHGDVTVERALDPVTGLPVLLYRFPGTPVVGAERLDPEVVWKVLERGALEAGGYQVTTFVEGSVSLERRPASLDDVTAARALAALAAATRAGVPHGDLGAHRVYRRGEEVWLEGYGVPWSDATPVDDARQLARSLLATEGHALSPAGLAALEQAASDGDASVAAEALERVASEDPGDDAGSLIVTPVPSAARTRNAASAEFHDVLIEHDSAAQGAPALLAGEPDEGAEPPPSRSVPSSSRPSARASSMPGSGLPRGAAPRSAGPRRERATDSPSFSKAPPPDVTYRHAGEPLTVPDEVDEASPVARASRRDRRRLWLLTFLLVAAIVLALLIVLRQRAEAPADATTGPGSYVVDVLVAPDRHPPVSLVVVSSPSGSRLTAGTVLGSVPKRVVLDHEGTWQLQGRFQDRRSAVVTVVVPHQGPVVLRFPEGGL